MLSQFYYSKHIKDSGTHGAATSTVTSTILMKFVPQNEQLFNVIGGAKQKKNNLVNKIRVKFK